MAEVLQLVVEADKGALYVFDKTGKYKKKVNEGGWGIPNFQVSDITKAELTVYPPESEEPIVIDVYPHLPNDEGVGFEILAQEFGLDQIKSGVWKSELRLYHSPGQPNEEVLCVTSYDFFDDVIKCCIESKKKTVDETDPSSKESRHIVELETLLWNANNAACKGDIEKAQRLAKLIELQCKCAL